MLMKIVARFILWLLTLVGLFLSIWIVIPSPIFSLLPLSVGMPELSPVLLCFNVATMILSGAICWSRSPKHWKRSCLNLCCISLSLGLSAFPLIQFPQVQQQAERSIIASLGRDYLKDIPISVTNQMRSPALSISNLWRDTSSPNVRIDRHIPFAVPDDGVQLALNIYRPLQVGKYPGIISIYGGAWQRGNPDNDDEFNRYIAAQGYVVWAIDYRHAPAYRFPAQIDDVRLAFQYIKEHAASNETDLDRVAIIGRSAGAQLAMLAAYDRPSIPIRAVVNYYGPVNLTAGYTNPPIPDPIGSKSVLHDFLGGPPQKFAELYRQASPINAVKPGLPPSLLIYGGKDHIIESKYGRYLAETLVSQGNLAIFIEIPWADHAFDAVFPGLSNQLALYYTERFLAWTLLR
jgi:acetyl esterase/lipase